MKRNFICGLDVGTFKICATCGTINQSGIIDILASYTHPAQGLKGGRIIDSRKLSSAIRGACERLREMCGIKVQRVYANIDSPDTRPKECQEKVSFAGQTEIKKIQIENLIKSAISANVPLGRKVIHAGFRNFVLDDQLNSVYPQGLIGREMKLNIIIVSALIPTINSLIKSIKDAGLILEGLVPSGCAQILSLSRASQDAREKDNILIDIGAGLTKIVLFRNKLLKDMVILPLGAQNITEDIATKLKVSSDCAEQLKIKYGRTYWEDRLFDKKIIIDDKRSSQVVSPKRLYEIIASKVDYLLQQAKKALSGLNYEDEKITEIIVTGGGSILEGFLERAEKILDKPVKMGFLYAVNDGNIQAQSALYATSIGLIHFGFKNRDRTSFYPGTRFEPFTRIINHTKQLYHEYF